MIKITDKIWVGNSDDEQAGPLTDYNITAILNVANDLQATCGWNDKIHYAQVGLIDGLGNPTYLYCAAILTLCALLEEHKVLVCCHTGSRAVVIVLMYLHLTGYFGLEPNTPTIMFDLFSVKVSWERRLEQLYNISGTSIIKLHDAHGKVFNEIDWRLLAKIKG